MKRLAAFMAALVLMCTATAQENEIRRIPQYSNDTEQNDYSTYEWILDGCRGPWRRFVSLQRFKSPDWPRPMSPPDTASTSSLR